MLNRPHVKIAGGDCIGCWSASLTELALQVRATGFTEHCACAQFATDSFLCYLHGHIGADGDSLILSGRLKVDLQREIM